MRRSAEGVAKRAANHGDDGPMNTRPVDHDPDRAELDGGTLAGMPADDGETVAPDGTAPASSRSAGMSAVGTLPPDPGAYDSERNVHARARGLAAPYIAGGRDPEPEVGRREERFYGRLLLIMVGLIVIGGFALGILGRLLGLSGLVGN